MTCPQHPFGVFLSLLMTKLLASYRDVSIQCCGISTAVSIIVCVGQGMASPDCPRRSFLPLFATTFHPYLLWCLLLTTQQAASSWFWHKPCQVGGQQAIVSLDSPVQSSFQGGQPLCPSKKRVMLLHQRRLEREGLILAGVSPTAETEAYKVISVHLNEPLNMMLGTILCFVLLLNVKFCYVFFSFLFFFLGLHSGLWKFLG